VYLEVGILGIDMIVIFSKVIRLAVANVKVSLHDAVVHLELGVEVSDSCDFTINGLKFELFIF
jgi:hypothetical protein